MLRRFRPSRARFRPFALTLALLSATSVFAGLTINAASAAKASAKAPILVGIAAVESGPLAPYEVGAVEWPMSYIRYTNARGGIDGHPIKAIILDGKGDPGQTLINYEQMWTQDHVVAIIDESFFYLPIQYMSQNSVPVFTGGANPNAYAGKYKTLFSDGGQGPAWSAQTAYWIVKIEHRNVKNVAVQYSPGSAAFNGFIQQYWHKLGATSVDLEPDGGPTADCTALVLKWKSEGVQYIDMQGQQSPQCILAETRIGWKPPLGQGGPITSEIGEAELIGKPYIGVVAGSPNTLYTGKPIYSSPSAADRTYVGNIKHYYPTLANYDNLNGTGIILDYGAAVLLVTALKGTLEKYGKVTPALLVKYTQGITNFDDGLQPPILSFEPDCKTGSDGTIWGFWHYNPKPGTFIPSLYMVPTSGPHWITNAGWLEKDKCYLSHLADKIYPNG